MQSNSRIERLALVLREKKLHACLITHTADIRWLTGFAGVFDEEQAHLAVLFADPLRPPELHTDSRYSEALRTCDADRGGLWHICDERIGHSKFAAGVLAAKPRKQRIAIEADLRLNQYRALEKTLASMKEKSVRLVELSDLVTSLRAVKDAEEIAALRAAQAITDAAFQHMLEFLRPGITEQEAACELDFFMRRNGSEGVAFATIVASGPNSARPHAVPGGRELQRGDIVLMDYGARLGDYRSDMTRTVVLGPASERQREVYAAVLAAQTAARAALRPGVTGAEAHRVAEDIINQAGFEGRFGHGLGHGVGIDIHELPVLAPKQNKPLVAGHVVTVEPGIYLPGEFGVRIEDFGVVTPDGYDIFTQSPHQLFEL
ncbi:MAG: aminopeptidase P family protein [Coriobacteriales bacterium]|jgi:Xaa-Pro aminopeptidase|nr:aminopeptidase P family protein [Coriobacteriales bacterium]